MHIQPNVFVLDYETKRLLYETHGLPQAQGFADAQEKACIIAFSAEVAGAEQMYQIAVADAFTNQIVAHGPILRLSEAPELLETLRLVIVPVTEAKVSAEFNS